MAALGSAQDPRDDNEEQLLSPIKAGTLGEPHKDWGIVGQHHHEDDAAGVLKRRDGVGAILKGLLKADHPPLVKHVTPVREYQVQHFGLADVVQRVAHREHKADNVADEV